MNTNENINIANLSGSKRGITEDKDICARMVFKKVKSNDVRDLTESDLIVLTGDQFTEEIKLLLNNVPIEHIHLPEKATAELSYQTYFSVLEAKFVSRANELSQEVENQNKTIKIQENKIEKLELDIEGHTLLITKQNRTIDQLLGEIENLKTIVNTLSRDMSVLRTELHNEKQQRLALKELIMEQMNSSATSRQK